MIQNYPISSFTPLETPLIKVENKSLATILESLKEPSMEERSQALERQGRTQAHTVYYSEETIIGVLWKNGSVSFGSNNSIGNQAVQQAYNSGQLDCGRRRVLKSLFGTLLMPSLESHRAAEP